MALLLGFVLALAAGFLVLEPLFRPERAVPEASPLFADSDDEDDPLLARRDRALAALKEIDFDRATGKLSEEDYADLKTRFTAEALEALKALDAAASVATVASAATDDLESRIKSARSAHAPRTTVHARFCIECGSPRDSGTRFCLECGAPLNGRPH